MALALLRAIPSPSSGGWSCQEPTAPRRDQLCLLYITECLQNTLLDLIIHYVKSSKICKCFQPGEQCHEGFYSLFSQVLMVVCLLRLLACPGFPSPPFFLGGGPCKYVQRPCSPSISFCILMC